MTVLSGGVGAARFLRGLVDVADPSDVVAVVNTGDDTELHGLAISPDLDTVTYTLADAIDPGRGWGLRDETWTTIESLARFESVRPTGSTAAQRWFGLGDRDLATHLYRTARLAEGGLLSEISDEIRRAFGVGCRIVPMCEQKVSTEVTIASCDAPESGRRLPFQEYFVKHQHRLPVAGIDFDGVDAARFIDESLLGEAASIIIAPSNPLVSIGPIRALRGVDTLLESRRDDVVAISPIVGGVALKGPADRMLTELGWESSAVGIARMYRTICRTLVIDTTDAHLVDQIENLGMRCIVTDTVMRTVDVARSLAEHVLRAVD